MLETEYKFVEKLAYGARQRQTVYAIARESDPYRVRRAEVAKINTFLKCMS